MAYDDVPQDGPSGEGEYHLLVIGDPPLEMVRESIGMILEAGWHIRLKVGPAVKHADESVSCPIYEVDEEYPSMAVRVEVPFGCCLYIVSFPDPSG